jgi:hypothetical protein
MKTESTCELPPQPVFYRRRDAPDALCRAVAPCGASHCRGGHREFAEQGLGAGTAYGDAGGRVGPNGPLGGGGPVRHLRRAHRSGALRRRRSSLIGPAFLVTRVLGLWLAARTTGRSYATRPEEPIGGRLRRLVPAVAVAAVAAAGMGKPGFDWTVAALAGNALLVLAAAARPQERAALARACLGAAWRTETPAPS